METRAIGSLDVSLVGLGCNNFGMRCDEERSAAVVHAALDCGITFFDTADVYGGTKSEEFLGRALAGARDRVVIATKFSAPLGDDPAHGGASARWIREAVEGSLGRLGTDRIDLYQQHGPDDAVAIEETQEALDDLVRAGKVRELGNSNFSAEKIDAANSLSARRGWARFVSAQNQFSLLERRPLRKVIPACERNGMSFLPYFPLASGLLTGKYRRDQAPPEGTRLATLPEDRASRVLSERNFDLVEALTVFAADRDHTILELAFAWLAVQPAMGSIIAGATSPDQVRTNAAAADWKLSGEDLAVIDAILSSADAGAG
ncbi:MAG: aldo/keto reductase [Actinobacteria bacterium]|nr:MAG: aldo/keto reductase [Actinomycetota bacterium]